ncbi:ThiF family adenylyltransferase [Chloroflexota bacterium]
MRLLSHCSERKLIYALIGAGGLGSPVALWLVRKGLGTLTIYDGDTVDLSNLHRQLFYKEDLYKRKAIQLAKNAASCCRSSGERGILQSRHRFVTLRIQPPLPTKVKGYAYSFVRQLC